MKYALRSVFSVFKQQNKNPDFVKKNPNLSKSSQKVLIQLVFIAEDISVSLTLKNNKNLLSN